jgi:hypothetical protein
MLFVSIVLACMRPDHNSQHESTDDDPLNLVAWYIESLLLYSIQSGIILCGKEEEGIEMAFEAPERKYGGRTAFQLVSRLAGLVIVGILSIISISRQSFLLGEPSVPKSKSVQVVELPAVEEPPSVKIDGACRENPYAASFHSSLDSIRSKADTWLENIDSHLQKANQENMKAHNWDRFSFFDVMAECDTACVGAACKADLSKIVCGLEKLQTEEQCVVYSIGGNNHWEFELGILEKTPCEVHTFDCTGNITRFHKPTHPRLSFHHICLGAEHVPYDQYQKCSEGQGICGDILTLYQIQIMLGHKRIDLFKIDIEGYEWPIFESWPELSDAKQAADMILPMQILVEVHYRTQMPALWPPGHQGKWRRDFKSAEDTVKLQEHLLKAGYAVAVRDNNRQCRHCTELTLVRYQCHHQSAQQ